MLIERFDFLRCSRALINQSVILPEELLTQTQSFIEENRHLGYTTKEEFIRDAIRFRLTWLKQEYDYVEMPKEQYDMLEEALRQMNMTYRTVEDFITLKQRKCNRNMKNGKRRAFRAD